MSKPDQKKHPVREYLDGLVWDQKPRVERWLIDYAKAHGDFHIKREA